MKFYIKHETRGRLRIHLAQKRMSYGQADTLLYYLENLDGVVSAKVYERTCDAAVNYRGSRAAVIRGISEFHYQDVEVPSQVLQSSGRAMNAEYQEKLISKMICHYGRKLFTAISDLNAIYTTSYVPANISGRESIHFFTERLKFRYWMPLQSECLYYVRTLVLQAPSCSCLESEKSWKSGHIRNP